MKVKDRRWIYKWVKSETIGYESTLMIQGLTKMCHSGAGICSLPQAHVIITLLVWPCFQIVDFSSFLESGASCVTSLGAAVPECLLWLYQANLAFHWPCRACSSFLGCFILGACGFYCCSYQKPWESSAMVWIFVGCLLTASCVEL